jgi:hypothetical protein
MLSGRRKSLRKRAGGSASDLNDLEDMNDRINHTYDVNRFILFRVEIDALIWDRDSHGLFDYEQK